MISYESFVLHKFEIGPKTLIDLLGKHAVRSQCTARVLINLIDTKAKCHHLKKMTCKGTLWHTVYVYTVYFFTQRGGGGWGRWAERRFTKLGRKYQHDWLYLQSINSDKHPAAKAIYRSIFLDDNILLWCLFGKLVNALPSLSHQSQYSARPKGVAGICELWDNLDLT
jgi:hypothetical protein